MHHFKLWPSCRHLYQHQCSYDVCIECGFQPAQNQKCPIQHHVSCQFQLVFWYLLKTMSLLILDRFNHAVINKFMLTFSFVCGFGWAPNLSFNCFATGRWGGCHPETETQVCSYSAAAQTNPAFVPGPPVGGPLTFNSASACARCGPHQESLKDTSYIGSWPFDSRGVHDRLTINPLALSTVSAQATFHDPLIGSKHQCALW